MSSPAATIDLFIRRAFPADRDAVAATITAGFFDDPVTVWLLPDVERRRKIVRPMSCRPGSAGTAFASSSSTGPTRSAGKPMSRSGVTVRTTGRGDRRVTRIVGRRTAPPSESAVGVATVDGCRPARGFRSSASRSSTSR